MFEGTYVVIVTPFTKDDEVDLIGLESNLEFYIKNGVHGVAVGGSTGEFSALSLEEHKKIIEKTVDVVNNRVPVIAGTAACSTKRVIELGKYSKEVGADGSLIVPPFYSKIKNDEIYHHYKKIAESVDFPIMIYNNPFTSKIDMSPEFLAKLAEIDNIDYVKESSGDVSRVWRIRKLTDDSMTVFCGADNLAYEQFIMGAKGWICVAANIFPKETSKLYEYAKNRKHEKARKLYSKLLPICNYLEETGKFTQVAKYGLDILGHNGGKPRAPFLPLDEEQKKQSRKIIEKIQACECTTL
jgi:4-hydroxy-tetrahydrodipicolinate synthase